MQLADALKKSGLVPAEKVDKVLAQKEGEEKLYEIHDLGNKMEEIDAREGKKKFNPLFKNKNRR
jgi:hypothetical protein